MRPAVTAVRLGQLGDLVMTWPALRWLAAGTDLSIVTGPRFVPLVRHAIPEAKVVAPDATRALAPADVLLDLHRVPRSRRLLGALPRTAKAPILRTRKEGLRRRALLVPGLRGLGPASTWPARHLDAAEAVRAHLGVPGLRPEPTPMLPRTAAQSEGRLGLVVGAAHALKRWPAEHFATLAAAWDGPVTVFGAPDEQPLVECVLRGSSAEAWVDPPETPLVALLDGLAGCDVVVSADTGPLHLAGALRVPVVGLFGPTPIDAGFWVWGNRGVALSTGADCSPCSMHGSGPCRRRRRICLEDLSPEAVLRAARTHARAPAAA